MISFELGKEMEKYVSFEFHCFYKEASVDQIRSLLRDNEREPVDEEEKVKTFLKKVTEGADRGGLKSNARLLGT